MAIELRLRCKPSENVLQSTSNQLLEIRGRRKIRRGERQTESQTERKEKESKAGQRLLEIARHFVFSFNNIVDSFTLPGQPSTIRPKKLQTTSKIK